MKVCTRCEGNTIQPGKGKTFCRDCPAGTVANKNKNQCGMCLCEVLRLVLSHVIVLVRVLVKTLN